MASSMEWNIDIPELMIPIIIGSMIAKSWNKYFSNRLIKYEEVQERRFVLDGMEENWY